VEKVELKMEFDVKTALRLARFDVESGTGLDQVLVQHVSEWERKQDVRAHRQPAKHQHDRPDQGVPVYMDYRGVRVKGRYHFTGNFIDVTDAPVPGLLGKRGAPSTLATALVHIVNPGRMAPSTNGHITWKETGTGRTLRQLRIARRRSASNDQRSAA